MVDTIMSAVASGFVIALFIFAYLQIKQIKSRIKDKRMKKTVGERGYTKLMYYSYIGDINAIRKELQEGADINEVDDDGNTPLHYSCAHDLSADTAAMRYLLSRGAKREVANKAGKTAYDYAKKYNHISQAAILNKVASNSGDEEVTMASNLAVAVMAGNHSKIINWLNTKHFVSVDAPDQDNLTPLMHAVKRKDLDSARILLMYGANPQWDIDGVTAEILAQSQDDKEMLSLLQIHRLDNQYLSN